MMIWRAQRGGVAQQPERALLCLGGRLWRLALLDQIAAEHAQRQGAGNESIEFAWHTGSPCAGLWICLASQTKCSIQVLLR